MSQRKLSGASKYIRTHGQVSNACNMKAFMKKVRETKNTKVKKQFIPLKRHLVHLAIDFVMHDRCKRAGIELRQARQLSRYK